LREIETSSFSSRICQKIARRLIRAKADFDYEKA
jgi:hypothetical protein